MPDPTTEFFDGLDRQRCQPLLMSVTGTIRFDLVYDDGVRHWFLAVTKGDLYVSREEREAECVVCTSRDLFDQFVTGKAHIYAAWLRNEVRVRGEVRLARLFERLLPGPPGAHHPREFVLERSRSR